MLRGGGGADVGDTPTVVTPDLHALRDAVGGVRHVGGVCDDLRRFKVLSALALSLARSLAPSLTQTLRAQEACVTGSTLPQGVSQVSAAFLKATQNALSGSPLGSSIAG